MLWDKVRLFLRRWQIFFWSVEGKLPTKERGRRAVSVREEGWEKRGEEKRKISLIYSDKQNHYGPMKTQGWWPSRKPEKTERTVFHSCCSSAPSTVSPRGTRLTATVFTGGPVNCVSLTALTPVLLPAHRYSGGRKHRQLLMLLNTS